MGLTLYREDSSSESVSRGQHPIILLPVTGARRNMSWQLGALEGLEGRGEGTLIPSENEGPFSF